jgi:hypothetical protein
MATPAMRNINGMPHRLAKATNAITTTQPLFPTSSRDDPPRPSLPVSCGQGKDVSQRLPRLLTLPTPLTS